MSEQFEKWLIKDERRLQILLGFIALVFLTGGGSRPDILSLIVLRPVAFICLAYGIWVRLRLRLWDLGIPFYLLLAFAVVHVVQLMPLTAALWSSLPGREPLAAIDAQSGIGSIMRPLTLSPAATLNSLFSLVVPFAAFLLYGIVAPSHRKWVIWAILVAAAVSCVLGLLQISGGSGGVFYLYRVTNADSPVGLFANRNHQAVFLACAIVLAAWTLNLEVAARGRALLMIALCSGLIAISLTLLLLNGSRGGVIFGAVAVFVAAALVVLPSGTAYFSAEPGQLRGRTARLRLVGAGIGVMLAAGLAAIAIFLSRDASIDRFFTVSYGDAIRGDTLPYLKQLLTTYFPAGSGFGTFEYVFRIVEPQSMLRPSYLNEAHNDWMQLAIEGGVAAVLILVAALIWLLGTCLKSLRRAWSDHVATVPAMIVPLLLFGASSAVDYPLRVPSLMLLVVILVEVLRTTRASPRGDADRPETVLL